MNIQNRKELCRFSAERIQNTPACGKISLIYAAVIIGLSVISALVHYLLGLSMEQAGGLSNIGTRSVLSALQTMLPLVQSAVVMCMELGFAAAMLRVARGQYVSPRTLRLGFDRFWVLLRYSIFEGILLFGILFASVYFGVMIFLATPLSAGTIEILAPLVSQTSILDASVTIPDEVYTAVLESMIPAYVICGILACLSAIPLFYRLRMSRYVIIDKPALGALAAMRESRKMMRRNCLHLFKLDLRLWWYFAATAAAAILGYGDQLLLLLGVTLPFSAEVGFFLFYALYWAAQFAIYYFLLPRVTVPYALAYDALRPKDEPKNGVVLGNIFQM
jgi:uncharacterized membrane protein